MRVISFKKFNGCWRLFEVFSPAVFRRRALAGSAVGAKPLESQVMIKALEQIATPGGR